MSFLSSDPPSTILITGNESGFDLALVNRLVTQGHKVIAVGRHQENLDEAKKVCPEILTINADLSREGERVRVFKYIVSEHPQVNVLINNSGMDKYPFSLVDEKCLTADSDWNLQSREMEASLLAPVHLSALFAPHFIGKKHAAILNVTSVLGFSPIAQFPSYCAAKAGLHSFTQSIRQQLRDTGVEVLEVVTPLFETDMQLSGQKMEVVSVDAFAESAVRQLRAGSAEICHDSSHQIVRGGPREDEQHLEATTRFDKETCRSNEGSRVNLRSKQE